MLAGSHRQRCHTPSTAMLSPHEPDEKAVGDCSDGSSGTYRRSMAVNQTIGIIVALFCVAVFLILYGVAFALDNGKTKKCPICNGSIPARYEIVHKVLNRVYVCAICFYKFQEMLKQEKEKE